ncbi:hypothetical protein FHT28_002260 [Rhizobium sp. SG570]|nr:hypothetical protein [Rhizobium sp. SG570]
MNVLQAIYRFDYLLLPIGSAAVIALALLAFIAARGVIF